MEQVTIGLAFIAGLLSFISPCCLPLVPAYIGYMGGQMTRTMSFATADGKAKATSQPTTAARVNLFLHGLAFVLGFTTIFVALGLMTTAFTALLGSTAATVKDVIPRLGGIIVIFFGLHTMGVMPVVFKRLKQYNLVDNIGFTLVMALVGSGLLLWGFGDALLGLPFVLLYVTLLLVGGAFQTPGTFWRKIIERLDNFMYSDTRADMGQKGKSGLVSSYLMGMVFSAGWTPCIGPMYGTILTMAASGGSVSSALVMLTAYSLGLGIPFLLTALLLDRAQGVLRRLQRSMRLIKLVSGGLLVLVGFLVATGELTRLTQNLGSNFADFSTRLEECGVGFFEGKLAWGEVGTCMNGALTLTAFNQSAEGEITAENSHFTYVFQLEQDQAVEVVFTRLTDPEDVSVKLRNEAGQILATNDKLQPQDEKKYLALANVSLTAGKYYVEVSTSTSKVLDFRLKVQPATVIVSLPTITETSGDSAVLNLAQEGLNSISGAAEAAQPVVGTGLGNIAPDFTATLLTGETVTLADLRGKVVLLNFWATWCDPCKREMPELQAFYETYQNREFVMLGIAVLDRESDVKTFREERGITFPLVVDVNGDLNDLYAIPGQPSTLILDQAGVIIFQQYSIVTEDQLMPVVEAALAKQP